MKATVATESCTGCGICEIICPEVFRMNGGSREKRAVVHVETVPDEAGCFCVDARDCCKGNAIQLGDMAPRRPTWYENER